MSNGKLSQLANSTLTSGKTSQDLRTPKKLFQQLNHIYKFDLDPCDSNEFENWLGIRSYNLNRNEDGLKLPWIGNIFVNPPFNDIRTWFNKAEREIKNGNARLIVFLVPSRTETKWFHSFLNSEYLMNHSYLNKRVTFANFDSAFIIGMSVFTLWLGVNNEVVQPDHSPRLGEWF